MNVSSEQLQQYRRAACARWQAEQRHQEQRRAAAWALAHQAAQTLKDRYGVPRVVVFGSLTHAGRFTNRSDVDLAAWGLTSSNWLRAIAAVRDLSSEIELNLVDVATCAPELLKAIEQDGVPL